MKKPLAISLLIILNGCSFNKKLDTYDPVRVCHSGSVVELTTRTLESEIFYKCRSRTLNE